ncbi:secretin N-terminal domain-containing protein [Pseudoxanthomonas suwonensis]|jgi:Type II secretory pathway, component PulD|uniref:secretin N-terminal domain-containing protein n=1 Tax=Pseudoxanthomonas suwonensis TaxID=314722 RepID=UPI0018CC406F|nr:secretin N-terminal domain-containing protein [Pseudoxanthomonas suwonensis]
MSPVGVRITAAAFVLGLLAGCASPPRKYALPEPLAVPPRPAVAEEVPPSATPRTLREADTPHQDLPGTMVAGMRQDEALPALGNTPVSVNVENLPIPLFINEVFGNMLGLNVNLDPAVAKLQELVTLQTSEAQRPRDLFQLARQVLADYGVTVQVEGQLVQLRMAQRGAATAPPIIVSGRALPDVPVSHRPVFQLVELEVVRSGDAQRWLSTLFGNEVQVKEDSLRNAVLISGKPVQVRQAIDALRVFDRPLMRGRISIRLEPAFMAADQLADRLVEVLNVQGFGASRTLGVPSSVLVVPVPTVNSVLVFAASQDVLDHTIAWARELDRPNTTGGAQSMFYYQVKNTKAADLARVLDGSMSMSMTGNTTSSSSSGNNSGNASGNNTTRVQSAFGSIVVDEPRNALIFQGDPNQWERLLTLIRQMDRAPRQVMVEVTIAEVTLEEGDQFGVAWLAKNGFGRFDGTGTYGSMPGSSSRPDDDSSGNGLTYLLDVAGQNRFALTAFANDNRVNILSVPRLLVKSGSEANIDIGTEVPTISMTTTSNQTTNGSTNLLQSIQYRKTGIILRVKPTVYSDDRIDLDITQEVSEALPVADDSAISSPSIFNRSLTSSLSLRDGGSVVMAGLMSERSTRANSGVPFLKDVPVLGNLFKSQRRGTNKTELVLMIVPYIIESDDRATVVSQAVIDRLELLELPPIAPPSRDIEPATTAPAGSY